MHKAGSSRIRALLPKMRRCSVSAAAAKSSVVVLVFVVMFWSTNSRVQHQLLRRHHHAATAIIGASFFGREAGGGCASRRRKRDTPHNKARALTWTACCSFASAPSMLFPTTGRSRSASSRANSAAHGKTSSSADGNWGHVRAIAEADLNAQRRRPRGTIGDRGKLRLYQDGDSQEVNPGVRVMDPMKTKLGRSELEVCRVINGLCQVRINYRCCGRLATRRCRRCM